MHRKNVTAGYYPIFSGCIVVETAMNVTMGNPCWVREVFYDVFAGGPERDWTKQSFPLNLISGSLLMRIRMISIYNYSHLQESYDPMVLSGHNSP
jgi:hypothetical protein